MSSSDVDGDVRSRLPSLEHKESWVTEDGLDYDDSAFNDLRCECEPPRERQQKDARAKHKYNVFFRLMFWYGI